MQTYKFPLWLCALALCGAMTLHAQDNAAQAAARIALLQKMQEADTNAPAASAETAKPVAKAAVVTATATAIPAKAGAPAVTPAPATATATATAVVAPKPAKASKATAAAATPKPEAPALPIPATKEQKLQQLLAKYKANQLTPQEYHEQRAAILAEP